LLVCKVGHMKVHNKVEDALKEIQNGHRIFIHGASATPHTLVAGLTQRLEHGLSDVEIMHLHTHGTAKYADPKYRGKAKVTNLFVGGNVRKYMDYENIDYLPCFLSEIPKLLSQGPRKVDVALIHVSPPDKHGYVTLGTSVDVTVAAVKAADIVIAQINKNMPKVHGDGFVHISQVDHAVEVDTPLDELHPAPLTEEDMQIGRNCASIIEDGACLQMGIGNIPNAVLSQLTGHRHLGVHSEMWMDGVIDLLECGALDNSNKKVHQGKTVSTFLMGTKRLYDYIDDNPSVIQVGSDYINNPAIIKRNPKVVAINSAVEVDLTGQVCADSVGHKIISGVGGQIDFMRGASLSSRGKPIIAINSRTKSGKPKIVPFLKSGAGVVTTRSHIHYVISEYGIANLYGKTLGERAQELIRIAHPDDREELAKCWHDNYCLLLS
jgi:4-hydroxybutyrate CoA-transferase